MNIRTWLSVGILTKGNIICNVGNRHHGTLVLSYDVRVIMSHWPAYHETLTIMSHGQQDLC